MPFDKIKHIFYHLCFLYSTSLRSKQSSNPISWARWNRSDHNRLQRRVVPFCTRYKTFTEPQHKQKENRHQDGCQYEFLTYFYVVDLGDDERNQWHQAEDTKAEESYNAVFEWVFLAWNELQFLNHHYLQKSIFIRTKYIHNLYRHFVFKPHVFIDMNHL